MASAQSLLGNNDLIEAVNTNEHLIKKVLPLGMT